MAEEKREFDEFELLKDMGLQATSTENMHAWLWEFVFDWGWRKDTDAETPADPYELIDALGCDADNPPPWLWELAVHLSEKGWRKK